MGNKTNGRDLQHEQRDDEIPACQSCRRKKARCSREQPCSQCVRAGTTCTYDEKRMKPGLRSGVVDSLSRRIETLENMFLGQEILWKQMWETLHPGTKFPGQDDIDSNNSVSGVQQTLRHSLLQVASQEEENEPPTKRRRTQSPSAGLENLSLSATDIIESDLLGRLVEFYFDNFHHWIPILHVRRFRHQIRSAEGRKEATHTLYAIIAACIRFINDPRLADKEMAARVAEYCRQKVLLSGMESFSVGNLQALVIIAFDTIARGRGPSSWSIVGGMARTVEQLQLSVEEDQLYDPGQAGETLIRRMAFLKPSTCWREAEERRRVFWTVFLMDRFCSVSTGWNVSLTSADVKRRLPCEGALWQNEDEVRAPYFGSSITKGMSHYQPLPLDRQLTTDPAEQDSIGGFAYCIEATESLVLVSNFFVHQPLDVRNVEETQVWLMRFKELDLRLVQWKLFLPSKWRDASKLNADGIMDSNLTLAHMTHNTVVILLHQAIAYPPHHWKSSPIKLHSSSSAETCIEAASEISAIGSQFLLCSSMLTNPQFSFCLFIAGRMLLTHARYNNVSIPPALDTLIGSLLEISTRWAGPRDISSPEKENLASVFARRLVHARDNLPPTARGSLDIRQPVYSETAATEDRIATRRESATADQSLSAAIAPSLNQIPSGGLAIDHSQGVQENPFYTDFHDTNSDSSLTLAFPPLPLSFQHSFAPFPDPVPFNPHLDPGESLSMASTVRNQAENSMAWNGIPAPFYQPVQDSHSVSAGSGDNASPGQQTSQFQGVEQGTVMGSRT